MSGVSLPVIPGAASGGGGGGGGGAGSGGGSRPGSGTGNYVSVPNAYFGQGVAKFNKPSPRPQGIARSYNHLPSLRHAPPYTSRSSSNKGAITNSVRARYSARHRRSPGPFSRSAADSPFMPTPASEECLKCLLKVPHRKCESHKYIRIGGGYRHGYWYVKCLLEQIEIQRQREIAKQLRLEAIKEHRVKAIKTYIRTKSGRLVERIIFLSEEDYEAFKEGKNVQDLLKKYLTADEAKGLESWDKDEVVAVKTYVRTKSGRLVEKLVYVSKDDYDAIKAGTKDAKDILKKYVNTEDGEQIEGWDEAKMKTIKTYVRTKSGRLIEKTIMISEDDYNKMIKEGMDPNEIIKKYIPLADGEQVESWQSGEAMKAIKTKIRTKSGRIIEKTVYVTADDYDRMMEEIKAGRDPNAILQKYVDPEDGAVESWEKVPEGNPMKVVKTYVRTKSGRLVEKTVMLTEDEYNDFMATGGDPNFLKKFMDLNKGDVVEDWEKASTVYSGGDDPDFQEAKAGQRIVGKDGVIYEVVVDPVTGKKFKKKVGHVNDGDSGIDSMRKGKGRKGKGKGPGGEDIEETAEERSRRKKGLRDKDSDSDYSYRSVYSAGGTKHVRRRRKRADGTYSGSESYHSDQDADGQARRRRRRRQRAHGGSANSYYSVKSAGGTRHVRRRRKRADGTYSASESYHSSDSNLEGGGLHKKKKKKKRREHGSDSDYSYFSEVSEGGTRTRKRKRRLRDAKGNVIGHSDAESYTSDSDSETTQYTEKSDGKGGKIRVKKEKVGKGKKGKKGKAVAEFSDASTDSDAVDLENMTEAEKKKYFEEKAKRKAEREKRRREKYGDKYDEMMAAHEKKKKDKKEAERKARLRDGNEADDEGEYEIDPLTGKIRKKTKRRGKITEDDEFIYEHDEHGRIIRKKRKGKDGEDSGSEYEMEYDEHGNLIKQKKKKAGKRGGDDSEEEIEYVYDKDGKLIGQKKKGKGKKGEEYEYIYDDKGRLVKKIRKGAAEDDEGSEYEYEYDEQGNLIGTKKTKGRKDSVDSDDGNYFEVDEKGQVKLREGKKKIDLSKLTDEDLRRLGIDPNQSKEEIARQLKEKFGSNVVIVNNKKKIGTRRLSDYGSSVDTDDLANDSDLDVTTLKGTRRVNVLMKRGGQSLIEHMKRVLDQSQLQENTNSYAKDLDERDGDIDFLSHYRLVDNNKLESYARAFVVEDDDFDTVIMSTDTKQAIEGVASVNHITPKQLEYVFKVLKIDDASQVTFRMFAVISALCERVTSMDPLSKHLLEICDLLDIERKMALYKDMFYCNVNSDRDRNFIKAPSLRIELMAGGLNWKQQEFILEKLQPNMYNEISFLDYICYIPLFLSMHDNIVENPLDMANNKYDKLLRKPSGLSRQRDHNPLGNPLSRHSNYQNKLQAKEILDGKIDINEIKESKRELITKYTKLPDLLLDKEASVVSKSSSDDWS